MATTATLSITVGTADVPRIATDLGYAPFVDDGNGNQIPNPQTQGAYIKQWVISVVKNQMASYEAGTAVSGVAGTAAQAAGTISVT